MDKTKMIAVVIAEIQRAGYLGDLIKSVLLISTELGFIGRIKEPLKLAEALETLVQSEVFFVLLTRILSGVGPRNEPGQVPAGWAGNLHNQSSTTSTRSPEISGRAL